MIRNINGFCIWNHFTFSSTTCMKYCLLFILRYLWILRHPLVLFPTANCREFNIWYHSSSLKIGLWLDGRLQAKQSQGIYGVTFLNRLVLLFLPPPPPQLSLENPFFPILSSLTDIGVRSKRLLHPKTIHVFYLSTFNCNVASRTTKLSSFSLFKLKFNFA